MIETLYQNRADTLHEKRSKNTVIQVTLTTKVGNTYMYTYTSRCNHSMRAEL